MKPAEARALRAALGRRPRAEVKRLFALVRAHPDRALLAAIAPVKRKKARRKSDPLARELEQTLRPIMGPSQEKADLLVEHLARKHRRKLSIHSKGLADAVRQLRGRFSDEQIGAGARSLVAHLRKLHGGGDSVV